MFKQTVSQGQKGFSLVELMVVVAIIGILATLAVPKFQQFQAKARQSEAKNNLAHIYTLEHSYHGDNDRFCTAANCTTLTNTTVTNATGCRQANDIGFVPTDCQKIRYQYTTVATVATFTATATEFSAGGSRRVFTGCAAGMDTWTINQDKALNNSVKALSQCL